MSLLVYFMISICVFYLLSQFYIYLWKINQKFQNITPTGYGIVFFLTIIYFLINKNIVDQYIFLLIFVLLNIIYWFDDLFNLNFIIRIILQVTSGVVLFFLLQPYFKDLNLNYSFMFFIISILFILVNYINFYDGADLNLSFFVISNIILIFFFNNFFYDFDYFLILLLSYFIAFSFVNFKPNNLYLGDSAALSIALLYSSYIFYNIVNLNYANLLLITPLFLILIDCTAVILVRLIRKENLLQRNYLHLYQKLQKKIDNKIYLLPSLLNTFFISIVLLLFNFNLMSLTFSFIVIFFISLFIYLTFSLLLRLYE